MSCSSRAKSPEGTETVSHPFSRHSILVSPVEPSEANDWSGLGGVTAKGRFLAVDIRGADLNFVKKYARIAPPEIDSVPRLPIGRPQRL
jgi:hypothetical protein